MKEIYKTTFKGTKIKVLQGDITEEKVEAIVNAANSYLRHGGGVALAIVRKGGREIQDESDELVRKNGPVQVGKAVITKGYRLKSKYVIHTVGPQWGEGNEKEKLKSAIRSVLEIAKNNNIRSISIPAVSCGIFGFPKEEGTKIIVDELINFLNENANIFDEIHLIGIDEEIPNLFKEALINA
ncbi:MULTISPECIES: macro domain-containing protein [Caldisericum]|jgi:O-acetyl-ADP-ribose deacetylase (regulator of RNase III)|uniref:Macrodomain protein n=1 Tax=Caldisericum exile TaxID=693075 RepID=A0A2J6X5M4_9BACT|nr:MAG: macrodomain protein [Caldisericum exile]